MDTREHQNRLIPTPSFMTAQGSLIQRKCACGNKTIASGECTECAKKKIPLQRKLSIGSSYDPLEYEADRVSDKVMTMPKPQHYLSGINSLSISNIKSVQRFSTSSYEEDGIIQPKITGKRIPEVTPPLTTNILSLQGRGDPLPKSERLFFEPRFGMNFSDVRIHSDAQSASLANSINARAFTLQNNVVFGPGQYSPGTSPGRKLLAHELTHVVQQAGDRNHRIQRHTLENDPDAAPSMTCQVARSTPTGLSLDVTFNITDYTLSGSDQQAVSHFVNNWHMASTAEPVRVDGYASIDGSPSTNWPLSCLRAETLASELKSPSDGSLGIPDIYISLPFAQGETEKFSSALEPNRRALAHIPSLPTPPVTPPTSACVTPTNPDLSGRAFNPTTGGEAGVCLSNPGDCIDAFGCRDVAFAAATVSGLLGPHLGPQDAFRHCMWNCCMTQQMGTAAAAEQFGTAHENSSPSAIPFDNDMDLHDNATGRTLGTPGADCVAECNAELASGRLRTIRGPETDRAARRAGLTPPTPPIPVTCIGASNQPWP